MKSLHPFVVAGLVAGGMAIAAAPAAAQTSTFRSSHTCGTTQIPHVATGGVPVAAAAAQRTVFMNRNGGTYQITNAATNSATNTANRLVSANGQSRTAVIAPLQAGFNWTFIVQCVKDAYAPYDVFITETEPTSGSYVEAVVGGTGTELGFGSNELFGIASADNFCGVTERGIAFSFSETHRGVPQADRELCATIAHEVGHLLALEHETLANDEMSYVGVTESGAWPKAFQTANSPCGTYPGQNQACSCGGSQTNSDQRLSQFVGRRPVESVPPMVAITSPSAGTVPRTFTITADATDASGIVEVAFELDGGSLGADSTPTGASYSVDVARLTEGSHTIVARATDGAGNVASDTRTVDVTFDCGGCGGGQSCVEGECLVDNGEACDPTVACAGGECAQTSSGDSFCTQRCDLASDTCPDGFACADVGAGDGTGLCNFSDSGGCCSTGSSGGAPVAPIAFGALGLAFLVSRRRRR